jgi:hypothetical protein
MENIQIAPGSLPFKYLAVHGPVHSSHLPSCGRDEAEKKIRKQIKFMK